jgi:hypothetical protein
MNSINKLYLDAQLSLASYSDFNGVFTSDNVIAQLTKLKGVPGFQSPDFTATSAQSFVDRYAVVSQYIDPNGSGFSATVFQDKQTQQIYFVPRGTEPTDVGDLDADIMLATGTLPDEQLVEMVNYFLRLQAGPGGMAQQLIYTAPAEPAIPYGMVTLSSELVSGVGAPDGSAIDVSNVCVAGHSLGGYLGMALAPLFGGNIQSISTYNAPGFYGDYSTFDTIVSLLGTSLQPFASDRTTNITGMGLDIIPAVGVTPGDDLDVFLESNAHSQIVLVDSLAVYDLLARIDDTLTIEDITGILSA